MWRTRICSPSRQGWSEKWNATSCSPAISCLEPTPPIIERSKDSKTILIDKNDDDLFGDGLVVIKFTPGHQALFLKLNKTGPVVLSGDL